jgi:hypothetical protein
LVVDKDNKVKMFEIDVDYQDCSLISKHTISVENPFEDQKSSDVITIFGLVTAPYIDCLLVSDRDFFITKVV